MLFATLSRDDDDEDDDVVVGVAHMVASSPRRQRTLLQREGYSQSSMNSQSALRAASLAGGIFCRRMRRASIAAVLSWRLPSSLRQEERKAKRGLFFLGYVRARETIDVKRDCFKVSVEEISAAREETTRINRSMVPSVAVLRRTETAIAAADLFVSLKMDSRESAIADEVKRGEQHL